MPASTCQAQAPLERHLRGSSGSNGLALLHVAVALQPAVTYFMMTAHADAQEVRDTVKAGLSYGFTMKPWNR